MNGKWTRAASGIAILLLLATVARAVDPAYPVKFQRTEKVGDTFAITSSAEFIKTMLGETADEKCTLDAVLTVKAVDEQGRESGFQLVINSFQTSSQNGPMADALPKGTKVDVVFKDGKAEFTTPGGALPAGVKGALGALFLAPSSAQTSDDMLGTKEKKKAGDTWSINAQAIAADAKSGGGEVNPAKVTGTTTLIGRKDFSGIPALEFQSSFEVTDFTLASGKPKEAKMTVTVTEQHPIDTANASSITLLDQKLHRVIEQRDDTTLTIDEEIKREETRIAK